MIDNGKPKVSVFCMSYNHEKTIGQTIEGILSQKGDFEIELIIHDDASLDKTAEIIQLYAKKHPKEIKTIIQRENKYFQHNIFMDFLLPVSTGEYIAVCDGDDYWTDENKLQKQICIMQNHKDCMLCFHAVKQINSDNGFIDFRPLKRSDFVTPEAIVRGGGLFCPSVSQLFRREVMECFPEFRKIADVYDYPLQILAASMGKVYYIDEIMAVYRFASVGSWTSSNESKKSLEHIANEISWLSLFNSYTNNAYSSSIDYHISRMWLSEYRKNADKKVWIELKKSLSKLCIKDRLIIFILSVIIRLFGNKANEFWNILKRIIFK